MLQIGLLGIGTVGSGVYEIINGTRGVPLKENSLLHIKKVLIQEIDRQRGLSVPEEMLTYDFDDICLDPDISLVVCVTGSRDAEYNFIKRSIIAGKHVVTANKEIMAQHLDELLALARENNVKLMFEASVGGGIPIIHSIVNLIKINQITEIQGILNGTTNYILTKMADENRDFGDVLEDAQELGYAEADPSADVDGFDVMRKISILASLCFGCIVGQDDVHQRGVGNITLDDISMASYFGYNIKYIAKAVLTNGQYTCSVTPVLLGKESVIANVNAEYNIIIVKGDIIGDLCFIGRGAGKDATANSIVSDILKIAGGDTSYENLKFTSGATSKGLAGINNQYYIRIKIDNYDQLDKSMDYVSAVVQKNKIIYESGNVYLITELLRSIDMNNLSANLKKTCTDVFYARIDKDLL
ncbi:MAG: homoserine dehydrogenase [Eubacteriaceae bacterium]|nr:homoserine dehydrogenase [Eubacteriaceae bacterium]